MIKRFTKRPVVQADDGFTLVELAVVILIIGILLALSLPAFLGVRKNSQHKAAQATTRVALAEARAIYSDLNTFNISEAAFGLQEPSLSWKFDGTYAAATPTAAPAGANAALDANSVVYWGNNVNFAAVSRSKGNRCYLTFDDNSAASLSGFYWLDSPATTDCKLPTALTAAGLAGWTKVTLT